MAKPYVYINLDKTLLIAAVTVLGVHYLNIQRDAVGIQKTQFQERVKSDIEAVVERLTSPFGHRF